MNWKGVLGLLLIATAINSIKGQDSQDCSSLSEILLAKRWFYGYDSANNYRQFNLGFTNTSIVFYVDNTAQETLDCASYSFANPVTTLFATKEENNVQKRYCFEIAGFNQEGDGIAYTFRRFELTGGFLQSVTAAEGCRSSIFSTTGPAIQDDFRIMIRLDLDDSQDNGFKYALDNGFWAANFPEAYDRGVPKNDPAILLSEYYATSYDKTGSDLKCEVGDVIQDASRITVRGNLLSNGLCEPGTPSYYNPLSGGPGQWKGMGNILASTFSADGEMQIVAIEDGRWYFACVRHRTVPSTNPASSDPKCIEYSIDLTDRDSPSCKFIDPYNSAEVNPETAIRDPTDPEKGFISFTACSTDCDPQERCEQESNCTQFLGNFKCGEFDGQGGYICPTDTSGNLCHETVDRCDPNPCFNNQNCVPHIGGFTCDCELGYKHGDLNLCEEETCILPVEYQDIAYYYKYDQSVASVNIKTAVIPEFEIIDLEDDTYDCERQSVMNGVYTLTVYRQTTANQRRCFQMIPHEQVITGGNPGDGDTFHLFRVGEENTHQNPISTATCQMNFQLQTDDPFHVLIPPNPTYVADTPFPDGQYYHVSWTFDGGAEHCANDLDSVATIDGNVLDLSQVCTDNAVNGINPIGKNLNIVYYWDAGVMLDSNGDSNGNVFLAAVTFLPETAPTYYCGRYLYVDTATPTIHISLNLNNGLAPECLINGNSQKSDDNHLYLKIESHRCHLTTACTPGGTCIDRPNQGVTCDCDAGYEPVDTRCEDINECVPSPCNAPGTLRCENEINAFECVCNEGWDHDYSAPQELCQLEDPCYQHGCLNGGSCVPVNTNVDNRGYVCQCALGYANGAQEVCEIDVNECLSEPCMNGGQCHEDFLENDGSLTFRIDHFRCICINGFTGTLCENARNNCNPNPCKNGGICVNYPHLERNAPGYYCDCTDTNHIWQHCEHPNECKTEGCVWENTIRCEDRLDGDRVCFCKDGFIGGENELGHFNGDCSEADTSDPCYIQPCENGGECKSDGDTYTCTCTDQFIGVKCSDRRETCADDPCPTGIACTDVVNATIAFHCDCPDHLTGIRCENEGDDDFGIVEQALVGLLCALVLGCIILAIWAICANRCGPCGPKGGCCP